jgi:hypothetical protein
MFTGQFKPGPGTNPAIGRVGQVEYVKEDRVELVVNDDGQKAELKSVINELKTVNIDVIFVSNLTPSSYTDTPLRGGSVFRPSFRRCLV